MSKVSIKNATLEFPIFSIGSTSIRHHLLEIGTGGLIKSSKGYKTVKSLSNINLYLEDGSKVGIIGHNGSGKSTLMRLIAGIYHPTSGKIKVEGRISTIFELGVGADQDLSGLENIIRIGVMMGISFQKLEKLIPKISEFTQLGNFLDFPVRTYSAGMAMRLYFAMALFSDPDILLIDEVFGVGDSAFQQRASEKLEEQIYKSQIFIFASHSTDLLKKFCDKCLLMDHGRIILFDKTEKVIEEYDKLKY